MLTKILAEFDRQGQSLSSRELAELLGKDLTVVEGMLETLVKSGRLVELGHDRLCGQCPVQHHCIVLPLEGRRFCLVPCEGRELPVYNGSSREAMGREGA